MSTEIGHLHWKLRPLYWTLGTFVSIGVAIFLLENILDDCSAEKIHNQIQFILGGTWHLEGAPDRRSPWFGAVVALQLLIYLGPVLGVLWILLETGFTRLRVLSIEKIQEKVIMNYFDLMKLRDRSIKNQIFQELPLEDSLLKEIKAPLDKAFEDGTKRWFDENLAKLMGKEKAEEILKNLREPVEKE